MKKPLFHIFCISIVFLFNSCFKEKVDPEFQYEIENTSEFDISITSKSEVNSDSYFSYTSIPPKQKAIIKTKSPSGISIEIIFQKTDFIYTIEENLSLKKYTINVTSVFNKYTIENTSEFNLTLYSKDSFSSNQYFSFVTIPAKQKVEVTNKSTEGINIDLLKGAVDYTLAVQEFKAEKLYKVSAKSKFVEYTLENTGNIGIIIASKDNPGSEQYFSTIVIPAKQKVIVSNKSINGLNIDINRYLDDYSLIVQEFKTERLYKITPTATINEFSFINNSNQNIIAFSADSPSARGYFNEILIKPFETIKIKVPNNKINPKFKTDNSAITVLFYQFNKEFIIYTYEYLVEYLVEGTCKQADVLVTNSTGGNDSFTDVNVPFKKGYKSLPPNKILSVLGQSKDQGAKSITVKIYYKGVLQASSTSNGEYAVAIASYLVQ
jgi:hypothetical protein